MLSSFLSLIAAATRARVVISLLHLPPTLKFHRPSAPFLSEVLSDTITLGCGPNLTHGKSCKHSEPCFCSTLKNSMQRVGVHVGVSG